MAEIDRYARLKQTSSHLIYTPKMALPHGNAISSKNLYNNTRMIPYRHDRKRKSSIQGQANGNIHKADEIKKHEEDALQDIHPYSTRESIYSI
ncbi:hypothetical protein [Prevotella sp.]|uniref:hypothetical protein n=1 Tax=uncultured Prevotella sp. TaxID=159272 RepID=UPI002634C0CA|nr:hypothetical protein [uncultured Prevotella sp.]